MKKFVVACVLAVLASASVLGCSEAGGGPAAPGPTSAAVAPAATSGDPVLVGAGDIASCVEKADGRTAALLDNIPGTVFTTGDNAYDAGTWTQFRECYGPTWGRHKGRTRPVAGNHDVRTRHAAPYFRYFGANAGPAGRGYYSYDLGAWRVMALDSNKAADPGSAQYEWLRDDLSANPTECAVAYWHAPVFSSGEHGNNPKMARAWQLLDEAGVDLVLAGHDHDYERFAPQDSAGKADPNGIRQIVVGTGGRFLRPFGTVRANSVARNSKTYGVLKLTLHEAGYDWEFVPVGERDFPGLRQRGVHGMSQPAPL